MVDGVLQEDYAGNFEELVLKVSPIKLPEGIDGGVENFYISTFMDGFPVDQGFGSGGFTLTPGTFKQTLILPESL